MSLRISASSVKSWFQYRCERKLVYEGLPAELRQSIPIPEVPPPQPWADFGIVYEKKVVRAYSRRAGVKLLQPPIGTDSLSETESLAFLKGTRDWTAAHQLAVTPPETFRLSLELEDLDVIFSRGFLDLVEVLEVDGRRRFKIIDIKSTHQALPFHKTQVAWYAAVLKEVLAVNNIDADVAEEGEIWHIPQVEGNGIEWACTPFRLRTYESLLHDFARRELRAALKKRVERGFDDTAFHVYFKCEQCKYLVHCRGAISEPKKPADFDVSAIPGMTHQSKAALARHGIRTVGQFVSARPAILRGDFADWVLESRGRELLHRGDALIAGQARRLEGRVTLRMPPVSDVKIIIVADRDPMAGRLATLGVLIIRGSSEIRRKIAVIKSLEDEAAQLREVLGSVVETLLATDAENRATSGASKQTLHIFTYEASEARDLAEALGRHMSNATILDELLTLVRIFPPEGVLPEPEYRGYHHLPASSIRNVLEETFAIPVTVSYDLRSTTAALQGFDPPPASPYIAQQEFVREFSSRLALDICRDLEEGQANEELVRADVEQRLLATLGLIRWLEFVNASVAAPEQFLRLRKGPFLLHGEVSPLRATALEVLRVQAVLEHRVAQLAALTDLAQTTESRRVRRKAVVGLQHRFHKDAGRWHVLLFRLPTDAFGTDFQPGMPGLILSDGHPDRVLDMTVWPHLAVDMRESEKPDEIKLMMRTGAFNSATFQKLWRRRPGLLWVLDRAHFDVNTARLESFLRSLDQESPS